MLFALCCFFALLGATPVVTVPENTGRERDADRHLHGYIAEVKNLRRTAIRSGKIRRVVTTVNENQPPCLAAGDTDSEKRLWTEETWRKYQGKLSHERWDDFEANERSFRASIRSKQQGHSTVYVHNDYKVWLQFFNKLRN